MSGLADWSKAVAGNVNTFVSGNLNDFRIPQPEDWSKAVAGNANTFAIGNLNEFQVSPFAPSSNTDSTTLSSIISTCCGHLNEVFDFTTYTLFISTIAPLPVSINPSQYITIQGSTIDMNAGTINLNGAADINFTTMIGSTISSTSAQISSLNVSTITSDVTISGAAIFRGATSTISTNVTLGTDMWGKYLFINKNEGTPIITVNTLPSTGTFVVIKNVASTIGKNVTVNVSPYGDFSTYTIQSFSTLRLMSMPDGWYSL